MRFRMLISTLFILNAAVVTAKDLPLHCPLPSMKTWNAHPRVFIPLHQNPELACPYCGTRYQLVEK